MDQAAAVGAVAVQAPELAAADLAGELGGELEVQAAIVDRPRAVRLEVEAVPGVGWASPLRAGVGVAVGTIAGGEAASAGSCVAVARMPARKWFRSLPRAPWRVGFSGSGADGRVIVLPERAGAQTALAKTARVFRSADQIPLVIPAQLSQ